MSRCKEFIGRIMIGSKQRRGRPPVRYINSYNYKVTCVSVIRINIKTKTSDRVNADQTEGNSILEQKILNWFQKIKFAM